jgi:hypothetical protein
MKHTEHSNKGSFSIEPMCNIFLLIFIKVLVIFICLVYKEKSLSLKSLLMNTAEKFDQDYWLNPGVVFCLNFSIFYIDIFRTL